jgi:hypothetical protein
MYRCPQCRTRRKDYLLLVKHMVEAGHGLCTCGGYHYAHRSGSKHCAANPWSIYYEAERRGATKTELEELRLEIVMENPDTVVDASVIPF